jgi:hypothetical protein
MNVDFTERIEVLGYYDIISFYRNYRFNELNNVIEGFKSDFFTIVIYEEESLDEYSLIYIGSNPELKGLKLKSGRKVKDRDLATFAFSKAVEDEFSEKNSISIFNTFQNIVKQTYENFGVLCIPENIVNLGAVMALIPPNSSKTDVDSILQIDPIEFCRSFFDRRRKISDGNGFSKVYLMIEGDNGYMKIGETKTKLETRRRGVAEATLMATDPMIKVISAWKAPKEIEKMLHSKYHSKRRRGEWFDLKPIDLKEINELMLTYETIQIESSES